MEINGLIMRRFFQLTRTISQELNDRLSPYNLHFSEWGVVLVLMEQGGMTQGQLASYLNVEPSAISRTLVRLKKKGYVEKKKGVDRRERQVTLTELAKAQYQQWDTIARQHRENLLMDFSEEEKEFIYKMLEVIIQRASQHK